MNIKYLSREEMIHEILNLKTISILIAMFFVITIVLIILFMSLKVFKEHAIIKSLLVSVMMSCTTCALLASVVYSHSISKKYSVIQKESKAQIVNIEEPNTTNQTITIKIKDNDNHKYTLTSKNENDYNKFKTVYNKKDDIIFKRKLDVFEEENKELSTPRSIIDSIEKR